MLLQSLASCWVHAGSSIHEGVSLFTVCMHMQPVTACLCMVTCLLTACSSSLCLCMSLPARHHSCTGCIS